MEKEHFFSYFEHHGSL